MKASNCFIFSRRAGAGLVLTAALAANALPALALPKSGVYDQVEMITSPRLTMKMITHLTFKGSKFRLEATNPQNFVPYIDIVDGQSFYRFIPLAKEAARNSLPKQAVTPIQALQDQTQQVLQGATKTGETAVGELNCDTYTRTMPDGSKATFYLDKDPNFPFLVKSVINHSDTEVTDTTTFENIKLNVPIPESTFTLPAGTKIDQAPPPGASSDGAGAAAGATPSGAAGSGSASPASGGS